MVQINLSRIMFSRFEISQFELFIVCFAVNAIYNNTVNKAAHCRFLGATNDTKLCVHHQNKWVVASRELT